MDHDTFLILLVVAFLTIPGYWLADTVNTWIHDQARAAADFDHIACEGEGCEQVLCYCTPGQPCPGAVEPGCDHVAEWFCEDCRWGCVECRIAQADDRAADLAEDMWRGLA